MIINNVFYNGQLEYNTDSSLTLILESTNGLSVGDSVEIYYPEKKCTYVERYISSIEDNVVRVKLMQSDPTLENRVLELEKKYEQSQEELTESQLALCDSYEAQLITEEQLTETQLALCDVYETLEHLLEVIENGEGIL